MMYHFCDEHKRTDLVPPHQLAGSGLLHQDSTKK